MERLTLISAEARHCLAGPPGIMFVCRIQETHPLACTETHVQRLLKACAVLSNAFRSMCSNLSTLRKLDLLLIKGFAA